MAKTSGRLDTNLEASGKVGSIMLRSTFEVTKCWKERVGRGGKCGHMLQSHNRCGW